MANISQHGSKVRDIDHKQVVLLMYSCLIEGTKDIVKESKCSLSPDDKATDVTTRCELEKVEMADVDNLNARQVAECLDDATVLIEDHERTAALAMAAITHLSLTSATLARVGHLDDVTVCMKGLEKGNGLLGLFEGLDRIADDEGNLLDLLDTVAAREDERRKRGSGKGRDRRKAALVLVHLDVPSAPGLRRGEHATTAAHVTERGLDKKKIHCQQDNICMYAMRTWPERWVPPPPTRGIRATARPVPQDSAEV